MKSYSDKVVTNNDLDEVNTKQNEQIDTLKHQIKILIIVSSATVIGLITVALNQFL